MIVDKLDAIFVEDVARALFTAIESVVTDDDFLSDAAIDAVLPLALAVAEELGYNATTAYELAFGAVANIFLDDA